MHIPVLLNEVIEYLELKPGMIVVDATAGGGGHSKAILEQIIPGGRLIAIDRDQDAVERVKQELCDYLPNIEVVNGNFSDIDNILRDLGIERINGALFDLGVSSFQIDIAARGFSFLEDGPLDMRFNKEQQLTAYEVVNTFSREELSGIIKDFGEERHAKMAATAIVNARKNKRIQTTLELAEIVKKTLGRKYYKQKLHPAVRTFQGIRIYVNDELSAVKTALEKTINCLDIGGKVCVISFHSLEDRIVKNVFRDNGREGILKILTKKPICATRDEVRNNYRARSAKLRVSEKT